MTQPLESCEEEEDTQKLEAFLPKPIRKRIMRHLRTLEFGAVILCVEKGRIRFIRRVESENVTHRY